MICGKQKKEILINVNVDPMWDPLRADPKFTEILKKMGLEK